MNISAIIKSHESVQAIAKKKAAAGMASTCEESNRPCKHNTLEKSQKVEGRRLPGTIQREDGTNPMHLDNKIRGNWTVSPSFNVIF